MTDTLIIDAHAHVLNQDTIALLQKEAPDIGLNLTPIDEEFATLEVGGRTYKPFPRGAWDLERRLADMEKYGYDTQVTAVCPQTFLYDKEPQLTLASSQVQNDQLAALAAAHPGRFLGLATLPMQAPELAAQELSRAMGMPGIRGTMIGSMIQGRNLDDPALEPVWAGAEETDAFVMVHPVNAPGIGVLDSYYLKNLIGNPFDTTVAAACLVFGGVLERHPRLKVCLSHGGGFAPYQAGRFVHGWRVREEPKAHLKGSPEASLNLLTYDTILHDPRPLAFLIDMVGAARVLWGTDYPFDMGLYDVDFVRDLDISDEDKATILGGAARELIGAPASAAA